MSNCVDVLCTLRLTPDLVDFPRLAAALERERVREKSHFTGDRYTFEEYVADALWWYAAVNSEVSEKEIAIRLGRGRSSHTFRDLRQLIYALSSFAQQEFRVEMQVRDLEYDEPFWTRTAVFTPLANFDAPRPSCWLDERDKEQDANS